MTKDSERAQVGWGFWRWWVLASTAGSLVGFAVGSIVIFFGFGVAALAGLAGGTGDVVMVVAGIGAVVVAGAAVGAAVGMTQWLVLWRQVSQPGGWILASIVGFTVGFIVLAAVYSFGLLVMGPDVAASVGTPGAVIGAVAGASVGITQWLFLRLEVSRAGWWVITSAAGFAMGGGLVLAAFRGLIGGTGPDAEDVVGLVLGLAAYGVITGGVMVWLLRQSATEELSLPQDSA